MLLAGEAFRMTENWLRFAIPVGTALVGGLLGIGIKEVFDRARDRKKEKRLSYDLDIGSSMTNVPESLAAKIAVQYGTRQVVGQLFEVTCTVENTGRLMVKDQYVRFSFPDGYDILDSYTIGNPIPELGIVEAQLDLPRSGDKRWRIGQLEKKQKARFGFLVDGPTAKPPTIHGRNDEGNVDISVRKQRQVVKERDSLGFWISSAFFGIGIGLVANLVDPASRNLTWVAAAITLSVAFWIFSDWRKGK
ncbi:hypothetical protein ABZ942_16445 [Nocardia sp. NPDC046473]|uniref:hypothetical protein n=1 Tax=Nocardia sp. NPDC046473 TaxID=3155733 RepID=UPI0033FFB9E8